MKCCRLAEELLAFYLRCSSCGSIAEGIIILSFAPHLSVSWCLDASLLAENATGILPIQLLVHRVITGPKGKNKISPLLQVMQA